MSTMDKKDLEYYVDKMKRLKIDRAHGPAPHKPALLLSVIAMIEDGQIPENVIVCSEELKDTFGRYMARVGERRPNIWLPFFHLKSDKFWTHHPMPKQGDELKRARRIRTLARLNELISHVTLDEDLFVLLADAISRENIRQTLIDTYFPKLVGDLNELISEEVEIAECTQELLEETEIPFEIVKRQVQTTFRKSQVRNSSFSRIIKRLYDYSCAVCKLRVVTSEGNSASQAAHIIAYGKLPIDDVRNGISLCPFHHWAFDRGLISLSDAYRVIVSRRLSKERRTEWLLTDLRRKKVLLPERTQDRPAPEAMAWHREKIFRQN